MEDKIKEILKTIDDSINAFQDDIPAIQKLILEELQPVLKQFDVRNGHLLNNVQNLKLLGTLKNKLQKVIINPRYKKAVEKFLDSFNQVATLQMQYFSQFNQDFTPSKTLPIIKDLAVEQTINDLVGQGMNQLVIGSVEQILRTNITTGGSYLDLQRELENHIQDNYTGQGSLSKYTRQITTDAINQYSAQYHDTLAQDLNFNWGRYVGSLITTSREFCIYLTRKDYFHKSELEEILRGHIDGHQCKLSSKTGIPLGMIPGTNAENFRVRRGGYNCGHQVFYIPDSAVPKIIRDKFINPAAPPPVPPVKPELGAKTPGNNFTPTAETVIKNNKALLTDWKKKGYAVDPDLFNLLGKEISFEKTRKKQAFYHPVSNKIVVGAQGARMKSDYFKKMLFPHEIGHAIHTTKGIINTATGKVSPEFQQHFKDLQGIVKGKEAAIMTKLRERRAMASLDQREQLATIADIIGSLTRGEHGYGHAVSYYKLTAKPEAEIFAHSMSLMKTGNEFAQLTPEIENVILKMIEYARGIKP